MVNFVCREGSGGQGGVSKAFQVVNAVGLSGCRFGFSGGKIGLVGGPFGWSMWSGVDHSGPPFPNSNPPWGEPTNILIIIIMIMMLVVFCALQGQKV